VANLPDPVSLSPDQIVDRTAVLGQKKTAKPFLAVLLSGLLGGAYIAFSGAISQMVTCGSVPGNGASQCFAGAVFASGLVYVMIGGADLFTGNVMTGIVARLDIRITTREYIINLFIVYFANFIGALIVVGIIYYGNVWTFGDLALGAKIVTAAERKCSLAFVEAFVRAVGCNWLVCLAIWMVIATGDVAGRIMACFFPVMTFVALGMEHCVANMYFVPLGLALKDTVTVATHALSWKTFLINNAIPVTLGNIVGGALFVGTIYFGIYRTSKKM
jgi:formate/nitrite transporter